MEDGEKVLRRKEKEVEEKEAVDRRRGWMERRPWMDMEVEKEKVLC